GHAGAGYAVAAVAIGGRLVRVNLMQVPLIRAEGFVVGRRKSRGVGRRDLRIVNGGGGLDDRFVWRNSLQRLVLRHRMDPRQSCHLRREIWIARLRDNYANGVVLGNHAGTQSAREVDAAGTLPSRQDDVGLGGILGIGCNKRQKGKRDYRNKFSQHGYPPWRG